MVLAVVGYGYITTSSNLSSVSSENVRLGNQIDGLNQQVSNGNEQIAGLGQQVSVLQQRTQTVLTETNTVVSIVPTVSTVTTTQTSLVTTTTTSLVTRTVTSITAVPQSSLIVTANSYDNASHTFTFQVQNSENYTIYAQLSASLWGQSSFGCNGQAGTFVSQVYTFLPGAVVSTQLSLTLGSYSGFCGGNPLSSIQMNFIIPQSTPVSPTYTFIIVPNYTFP